MERQRYCANISPKRKPIRNKEARVCGAQGEETITIITLTSRLKATQAECQSKHGRGRQISVAMVLNFLRSLRKPLARAPKSGEHMGLWYQVPKYNLILNIALNAISGMPKMQIIQECPFAKERGAEGSLFVVKFL